MFLMMITICSASLMKFDELWKNVEISWYFKGAGTVGIFLWTKLTFWMGSNFTCMFLMMIPINSASLMKFKWTLKKSWNFMIFQRACTVGIFLCNKSTSLNGLKFHMHVSDDDLNMFCKFDEIWWTLKKCWKFMIFLGPALSAFF